MIRTAGNGGKNTYLTVGAENTAFSTPNGKKEREKIVCLNLSLVSFFFYKFNTTKNEVKRHLVEREYKTTSSASELFFAVLKSFT